MAGTPIWLSRPASLCLQCVRARRSPTFARRSGRHSVDYLPDTVTHSAGARIVDLCALGTQRLSCRRVIDGEPR